jgi:hypothetical protein
MRIWMIILTATALAGCAVNGADRVDASRPTVTYDLDHAAEYDEAAVRAEEWCSERYNGDARVVDEPGDYDDTVTFECVGD